MCLQRWSSSSYHRCHHRRCRGWRRDPRWYDLSSPTLSSRLQRRLLHPHGIHRQHLQRKEAPGILHLLQARPHLPGPPEGEREWYILLPLAHSLAEPVKEQKFSMLSMILCPLSMAIDSMSEINYVIDRKFICSYKTLNEQADQLVYLHPFIYAVLSGNPELMNIALSIFRILVTKQYFRSSEIVPPTLLPSPL